MNKYVNIMIFQFDTEKSNSFDIKKLSFTSSPTLSIQSQNCLDRYINTRKLVSFKHYLKMQKERKNIVI